MMSLAYVFDRSNLKRKDLVLVQVSVVVGVAGTGERFSSTQE